MPRLEPRTLYLNAERIQVRYEGSALRLCRPGKAAEYVPLARVSRAVVRGSAGEGLLQACLALVEAGAVVHFQDGHGQPTACLQPAQEPQNRPVQELTSLIETQTGLVPYHWWRDAQRRHAWSLVFRRGPRGDFQSACRRLEDYLRKLSPLRWIPHEIAALGGGLQSWLQAELHRSGWRPACRALAAQGEDLEGELRRCLYIPLLLRFVRWRRHQPPELTERRRVEFLELQLARPVPSQLHRHLQALTEEYYVSWQRMRREEPAHG
ncbi:hypothetical protein [Halorhodospira halophila]|uniref:Uncharacterized protein n=1 Tax=Halorhodospira halophila (strain DSM 244 / SL1) TaxID=349124 RepID=A1WUP4_HALHL|nr:hypothetical protein [Halorhodospira halophila]ABM61406.1 hypothetical protein Hhal_0621 [Halorhodospira halophila SL1]MBK1728648.1 hypothetical protein [Halorhodospira halophila]